MEKTTTFSKRLQLLLDVNSFNAASFAQRIGISKSLISRYLSEQAIPRQERIDQIAKYFNVSHGWLMGYDCEMYDDDLKNKIIKSLDKLSQNQMIEVYSLMREIIVRKK